MKYQLADLLDIPRLQLALDSLYHSSRIPSAIIDNNGKIHAGSGWQDICTKFHRVHPEAEKRCIDSDLFIIRHIHEANPSIVYKCPHGLVDTATPIIIEGEHLGNVFTGQLFIEEPSVEFFRSQARTYGFDEGKYIDAVLKVPVISEQALRENLAFIAQFTGMLAEMGLKHKKEKEAAQHLRESEARFRNIFRENSSVMLLMDPESGRIEDANPAAAAFYGYPEDVLRTMTIAQINVLSGKEITAKRAWAMHKERSRSIFPHRLASGEIRTVEIHSSPVEVGGRFLLFSIIHDITERMRAVGKLRESEDRYRDLVEHSQDLICTHDLEGRILSANPSVEKVLGYTQDELLRMNFREILAPEVCHLFGDYLDDIRTQGTAKGLMLIQTRKGEQRIWEYKNTLRTDGVTKPIVRGMAQDVTERKRVERELRSSEKRYRSLFENMVEGYAYCRMIYDGDRPVDFLYLTVNEAFGALTGLKDAVGKKVSELIPGIRENDPQLFEKYGRVASTGIPERFEIYVEGMRHWFSISAYSPKKDHFVAVFDVITERKRAEAEKEKLQTQLSHAMKMEAVGRLAGGVAHDFNNLLTAIIGNISLAQTKLSPADPAAGMLAEANKAAERAATLTQQLLAFSRQQIIEPKVLNLNELITDVHGMLISLIREDIEIETAPGMGLGAVKIDPGQFGQIVINLVVNARDAMPDGGNIFIETSNVDLDESYCESHPYVKPGPFVMLAVSDTGYGMSEEVKAHIFEPFFTTKSKGSGTGLGLATTYGIVKQAGGSIEVYSEVGMGTTFKIYLPREEGQASKLVRDAPSKGLLGGSETVLVVEDEDIVRDLCAMVLEKLGYRVLQASNGKEAIALSGKHNGRIDLLVTDVVMPGMNGGELSTQLILHRPEMKVLFTSGYTENVIVHHGVMDDEISFLGKPYSPSALAKKIREVLDKA